MKNKKVLFIFILFLIIFAASCVKSNVEHDISEYILKMDYKDDFKVLQLTDIHLANKDDRQRQYDFLEGTINEADADLIVITGDSFTFGDKRTAKEYFNFLDSFKTPWTLTFGNHDEQCYFSIDWLTRYLNKLNDSDDSYCIFKDIQDDNVNGNANFAINLMDGDNIKYQIIIMDSNRYNYGEYIGYDYFKEDQVEWYKDLVEYTKNQNGGNVVPSSMYFHIPLPEWNDAWNAYETGEAELISGVKQEKSCVPELNPYGFFDIIKGLGSTKAMFCGHDHLNSFIVKYEGIYFGYGINSTDRIYFDGQKMGGTLVTIKNDASLSFTEIVRTVEDYK